MQDAIRNADFADVVQRTRQVNQLYKIAVHLIAEFVLLRQMLGEHPTILPHAIHVGAGFLIVRFGQFCQAQDRYFAALQRQNPFPGTNANARALPAEMGLLMNSSAPAFRPSTMFCVPERAVSMIMYT